jgi:predicted DNA-binding transcriptional regulator AlpA
MNLLTVKQVAEKLSCAVSNVYRIQSLDPTFPRPISIGLGSARARGVRWVDDELTSWLMVKVSNKTNEVHQNEDGRSGQNVHTSTREEVTA